MRLKIERIPKPQTIQLKHGRYHAKEGDFMVTDLSNGHTWLCEPWVVDRYRMSDKDEIIEEGVWGQ